MYEVTTIGELKPGAPWPPTLSDLGVPSDWLPAGARALPGYAPPVPGPARPAPTSQGVDGGLLVLVGLGGALVGVLGVFAARRWL